MSQYGTKMSCYETTLNTESRLRQVLRVKLLQCSMMKESLESDGWAGLLMRIRVLQD